MKRKNLIKKNWKTHACWAVAVTMIVAYSGLWVLLRENKRLKSTLTDSQQTLEECQHSFRVWESQISSGEIKVLKRDGDTEIIERWEMTKEPATDTWILK